MRECHGRDFLIYSFCQKLINLPDDLSISVLVKDSEFKGILGSSEDGRKRHSNTIINKCSISENFYNIFFVLTWVSLTLRERPL